MIETYFECNNSENKVIIPLDPSWSVLGIQVSGGLDSALLTYLTALAIRKHKLDVGIRTISCDVGNKPDYLPTARKVIKKLKELLPDIRWENSYEYRIPLRESKNPYKLYASTNHIRALFNLGLLDYEYNGVTLNPPEEVRKTFHDDEFRQTVRDSPESIYVSPKSARPMAFCDKQGVVELYKQFGIFDSIFPITLSCDVNKENMIDGKLPCGQCWWCDERRWGLVSNGENPNL